MATPLPSRSQRLRRLFALSPGVRRLLWICAALVGVLTCCLLVLVLSSGTSTGEGSYNSFQALIFGMAVLATPLAVVFLVLAALFEKRAAPRAALWLGACLLIGLAGLGVSGLMLPDLDLSTILVFLLTGVGGVFLALSLPGIYFLAQAWPEVGAVLQDDLQARSLAFVRARGQAGFVELSAELGLPLDEVDNLLDGLLRSGQLAGTLDVANRCVFTGAYLAERQRLLLEIVQERGRVSVEALAGDLKATPALVREWIYQLVQRGQFNGAVNWRSGWIYAPGAAKIGRHSQCPQCGGRLSPGRSGSIHCLYCGAEVFDRQE